MKHSVRHGVLISLMTLSLAQGGCQGESTGGNNAVGIVQSGLIAASDVRYMHELASATSGPVRMDLSDPAQYRFLLARVAASGKTRQNSPQFFQMIDDMKQRHAARGKQGADTQALITQPRDHLLGNVVRVPGTSTFRATTFATIQDGADYNFVDGVGWSEDGSQQLTDYGWGEEYGDGRKLTAQPVGPTSTTAAMFIKVDSLNLVSINGVEESFYFLEPTQVPAEAPGGVLEHPRDANGDGIVTICLDRDYGDCDYPLVGARDVKFPVKGHIIFPTEIVSIYTGNTETYMKLVELSGGPRNMQFGPLSNWLVVDPVDKRKVSWNIPQDSGRFFGILFQRYEDVDFFFSIKAKLKRGPGAPPTQTVDVTAKISSIDRAAESSTGGMPKARDMQMVYSCLAKGTQVQLADGKTAKVEDITRETLVESTMVKSEASGLALPVADISVGIERIPMVHIADSAGRELLLTSSHPVMTPDRGVVWAEELAEGSQVLTNTGASSLVKVSREMYSDKVYNLKLNRSQLAEEQTRGSTMYANGFLVGDLAMQKAYEFKDTKDLRANVLSRLPEKWHTDYFNSPKVASR